MSAQQQRYPSSCLAVFGSIKGLYCQRALARCHNARGASSQVFSIMHSVSCESGGDQMILANTVIDLQLSCSMLAVCLHSVWLFPEGWDCPT